MMERVGFVSCRTAGTTGYRTSPYTIGTLFYAEKAWSSGFALPVAADVLVGRGPGRPKHRNDSGAANP